MGLAKLVQFFVLAMLTSTSPMTISSFSKLAGPESNPSFLSYSIGAHHKEVVHICLTCVNPRRNRISFRYHTRDYDPTGRVTYNIYIVKCMDSYGLGMPSIVTNHQSYLSKISFKSREP